MSIPDFQSIMLPLLKLAEDGQEHANKEAKEKLALHFSLSEAEREELLPSGRQTTFDNRVAWARSYLKMALLLEVPRRGFFRITQRGKSVIQKNPEKINIKFLEQFPEFSAFKTPDKPNIKEALIEQPSETQTPEETLDAAHIKLKQTLAEELIQTIKACSPAFFEKLVVDLLVRMGYGGTRKDAGKAVGKSGDGGIDGIIKEDRLGLDAIYIQAKKWEGTVGRPEIQKFAGALMGHGAHKGVFITTSNFSKEAIDFASSVNLKIVLIDGQTLATLMIDHNVGVSPIVSYEIKKLDLDYFIEA
ncbi:restriction system protein [Methylomagnum ishizawai]|uniref:Restriction system protein n=1 Tax=Methylomagnum ishizawai TaxID=1760988 RepID=A0A1Y6CYY4_9GAMM|nr:restriction endonuclease [Methylomagnum ishizawai]SMF95889.1 restriction system protein [Methylomagnum ishizawai]